MPLNSSVSANLYNPDGLPIDLGGPVDHPFEPMPASVLDGSIVDRFDYIVSRKPTRLAISDANCNLTYAELATLVNRIAAATVAAACERPGPIAILLPGNVNFAATVLGVLAANRGYVPLDPGVSIERNLQLAMHSAAAAVISVSELAGEISSMFPQQLPVVNVDALDREVAARHPRPGPDDLACIIYTSGSTGSPKGVYMSHRILLHSILQSTNSAHLGETDRIMFARSPGFIGATRDILAACLNGASLHVMPPSALQPAGLVNEIRARGITIFRGSPTLLRRIAEVLEGDQRLESVRLVHLTSERAEWSDVDICRRIFAPQAPVMVIMGSTEAPATSWFIDEAVRATAARLPCGRVIPDRTLSLVDDYGRPVADGQVGEFVLSSRFLALGYWRDPETTARVFAVSADDPEVRIYRTGDLGRRRADGLFEHIGRKDDLIKLHGYRIEPAEIENTLRNCYGVGDATIVIRRDDAGAVRSLAGYVEARSDAVKVSAHDLIANLRKYLPPYMIPAEINVVDALPRLANLKIDRVRLAELDAKCRALAGYTSHDSLAEEVAEIFASVIGVDRATFDDNVLSLGGDSLQAIKVAIELESRFGVAIPVDVFESTRTILELARWIAIQRRRRRHRDRRSR